MSDKPFLLFCYPSYYPGGGAKDFEGAFATEAEARLTARRLVDQDDYEKYDYYHIVQIRPDGTLESFDDDSEECDGLTHYA